MILTYSELVASLRQLHCALAEKYQELEMIVSTEKILWLLEYLNHYELRLSEEIFHNYNEVKNKFYTETKLFSPSWRKRDLVGELECMNLDDAFSVINTALHIDTVIVESLKCEREKLRNHIAGSALDQLIALESFQQIRMARETIDYFIAFNPTPKVVRLFGS